MNTSETRDETIELILKFKLSNYRIEGREQGVRELKVVLGPGESDFFLLEKLDRD